MAQFEKKVENLAAVVSMNSSGLLEEAEPVLVKRGRYAKTGAKRGGSADVIRRAALGALAFVWGFQRIYQRSN